MKVYVYVVFHRHEEDAGDPDPVACFLDKNKASLYEASLHNEEDPLDYLVTTHIEKLEILDAPKNDPQDNPWANPKGVGPARENY